VAAGAVDTEGVATAAAAVAGSLEVEAADTAEAAAVTAAAAVDGSLEAEAADSAAVDGNWVEAADTAAVVEVRGHFASFRPCKIFNVKSK